MNPNEHELQAEKAFLARKRPFSYLTKIMVRERNSSNQSFSESQHTPTESIYSPKTSRKPSKTSEDQFNDFIDSNELKNMILHHKIDNFNQKSFKRQSLLGQFSR